MRNLSVSETEQATFNAWHEEHLKNCPGGYDDIIVRLTETGVGVRVLVSCGHCSDQKDITDYDSW